MHEVVTLQFGQQANYLGTHYWNAQESYFTYAGQEESPVNHDASFRAGIGADGHDTYTPRTLIYDLKGAFGTLRRDNALYQLQQQSEGPQHGQWSGSTIPLQLPPIAPSSYQQALDSGSQPPQLTTQTVRFWSDYNHLFYHPRSIVQLNEYELNSSLMPFERWQTGEDLFASLDREHDLLDRDLRPFLEECDQLQGLQILSGIDDAWGGFASRYLERIADDLGKGCRWVFGLKQGRTQQTSRERAMLQAANAAQSLYALNSTASVHVPLTSLPASLPRYVSLGLSSTWHASALQAAVMESLTLPTRLRQTELARATFDQLETTLNNDGNRRLAVAAFSADDPSHLEEVLEKRDTKMSNGVSYEDEEDESDRMDIDMFPTFSSTTDHSGRPLGRRSHVFSKTKSLRGTWKSEAAIEESNADSRDRYVDGPHSSEHQSQLLFPLLSSYPHIFRYENKPEKLAIKTSLSTSTAVANHILQLEGMSRRLIGIEDREALCDGLTTMAEEYEEGWSGSDDSDDDG